MKNNSKKYLIPRSKFPSFVNQNGFTIVELIITVVVLSFGILGIYAFFYPTIFLTSNFSLHSTADYLAQEGIDITKNIRDNNILQTRPWSQGLSDCSGGCQLDYKTGTLVESSANVLQAYSGNPLNLNNDGLYSYDPGTATRFKRRVTITPGPNSNILKVVVSVMWDYNNKSFAFDTVEYIYNLKP